MNRATAFGIWDFSCVVDESFLPFSLICRIWTPFGVFPIVLTWFVITNHLFSYVGRLDSTCFIGTTLNIWGLHFFWHRSYVVSTSSSRWATVKIRRSTLLPILLWGLIKISKCLSSWKNFWNHKKGRPGGGLSPCRQRYFARRLADRQIPW